MLQVRAKGWLRWRHGIGGIRRPVMVVKEAAPSPWFGTALLSFAALRHAKGEIRHICSAQSRSAAASVMYDATPAVQYAGRRYTKRNRNGCRAVVVTFVYNSTRPPRCHHTRQRSVSVVLNAISRETPATSTELKCVTYAKWNARLYLWRIPAAESYAATREDCWMLRADREAERRGRL